MLGVDDADLLDDWSAALIHQLVLHGHGFDAWVHFSAIEMDGYRSLDVADQVEFDFEAAQQDSFRFVATRVRKL